MNLNCIQAHTCKCVCLCVCVRCMCVYVFICLWTHGHAFRGYIWKLVVDVWFRLLFVSIIFFETISFTELGTTVARTFSQQATGVQMSPPPHYEHYLYNLSLEISWKCLISWDIHSGWWRAPYHKAIFSVSQNFILFFLCIL